jgi:molecular chaperone HtpG
VFSPKDATDRADYLLKYAQPLAAPNCGEIVVNTLHDTKLYKELLKRAHKKREPRAAVLLGAIASTLPDVEKWLGDTRVYFRHFTDHTLSHSIRIVHNIDQLLEKRQLHALTATEIYLILSSALLHDAGMVISDREAVSYLSRRKIISLLRRSKVQATATSNYYGVAREVLSETIRRTHGARARILLASDISWIKRITLDDSALAETIGKLCESHTMERSALDDPDLFPTVLQLGTDQVNMQFISILLRIGDLLDITTDRACPLLRHLAEPLSVLSASHWEQYKSITVRNVSPRVNITISGHCHTQEAERLLRDWVRWLEEEVQNAVLVLNLGKEHYRLALGRVEYRVTPATNDIGKPKYEFLQYRFNLQEETVLNRLLGKELYGRPDVAYRELMQNALDATRARIMLEVSRIREWQNLSRPARFDLLRDSVMQHKDEYAIQVRLSKRRDPSGAIRIWFSISDHGIGMSRRVIEQ